jgi:hypothetical protein
MCLIHGWVVKNSFSQQDRQNLPSSFESSGRGGGGWGVGAVKYRLKHHRGFLYKLLQVQI